MDDADAIFTTDQRQSLEMEIDNPDLRIHKTVRVAIKSALMRLDRLELVCGGLTLLLDDARRDRSSWQTERVEMLEACRLLVDALMGYGEDFYFSESDERALATGRAVLAKAEGRTDG